MRPIPLMLAAALFTTAPAAQLGDATAGFAITASPAAAQTGGLSQAGFEAFLPELRARALAGGVRPATLERVFPALTFSSRTVELDRSQPGGTPGFSPSTAIAPFAPYRQRHLTASLINRGRARYTDNYARLQDISRRFGVPAELLVAIWGKESSYGSYTGDFDLLNSLASLAYEGRRRDLFADEFVATLKMLERGYPRDQLKGSWAGATGQPQFLPSVYLKTAADGDGDGRADIWRNQADTWASIANYFRQAGWRPGLGWGMAVAVPAGLDRASVRSRLRAPRCARVHERHSRWMPVAEWRRLGVTPVGSNRLPDDALASLLEPDGQGATAYLLTTNYRAILDYNCSNFYGLTVGLLADSIRG